MSELKGAIAYVKRIIDAIPDDQPEDHEEKEALRLVVEAAENPLTSPVMELVFKLQDVNAKDASFVSNSLYEANQREINRLRQTLHLIRARITGLVGGDYMPTSHAIEAALYPEVDD